MTGNISGFSGEKEDIRNFVYIGITGLSVP